MNDIIDEPMLSCVVCLAPTFPSQMCRDCREKSPFEDAFVLTWRDGAVESLINSYKFERVREASEVISGLLGRMAPQLPSNSYLVPIPTIARHVRMRGYDHNRLALTSFAAKRGYLIRDSLERASNSVQHGASKQERALQAMTAFKVNVRQRPNGPIVLFDDIYTTGATVHEAARLLRSHTDQPIYLLIVARQPRDK